MFNRKCHKVLSSVVYEYIPGYGMQKHFFSTLRSLLTTFNKIS